MKRSFRGFSFLLTTLSPAVLLAILLATASCSTTPIDENDPRALLKEAEDDIASDHYQIAIEKLKNIKNKFPYSKQAVEAQLKIGDVYFLQESFAEAAAVYEAFKDLHPKHEKAPYAMYRLSKSFFNDIPSPIARDLTPATHALEAYEDFLRRFPRAPEAEEAKKDVTQIRNLLAEKEVYVGNFYVKRGHYDSAKPRFKKVLELYPETQSASQAEIQLTEIEKKLNQGDSNGDSKAHTKFEPGTDGDNQ